MKKLILLIIIMAFASIGFAGCDIESESPEEPEDPVELLLRNAPEGTAAILINQPAEDQLNEFKPSERLVLDESIENFLLIPSGEVEEITIWHIEFNGTELVRGETIYKNYDPHDEYILHLIAMRPEGSPNYELSLLSDEGEAFYYIAYDGKDGTPNIEYVKYK